MLSFVSYVLRFRGDDTALGDVSRDISHDPGVKRDWGYNRLVKHLNSLGADVRVYKILEEAKTMYDSHTFS